MDIRVFTGSSLPAWILVGIMLAGVLLASADQSYNFSLSKDDKPPILLGVYSQADTNGYLGLTPTTISSTKDLSVVGGGALLEEEGGRSSYGFLALFPSDSFTKFKLLDIKKESTRKYTVLVGDVDVISRISGASGSKGIENIAGPPTTEVWVLYTVSFFFTSLRSTAINVAAFNEEGSLKCNNGFTLDKLKPGHGSFYSFSPVMVHDGDKAYVIAPISTSSNAYARNPLIVAEFDAKCGLDRHVSHRVATSPDSSVIIYDAAYSSGYIYAVGRYNSGASGGEEEPKILLLKISTKTLDIVESKALIIPWPGEAGTWSSKIDAYGDSVAIASYYSSKDSKGLATTVLDASMLQPLWTGITNLSNIEGSGYVASVIIKNNTVMTLGSLYNGISLGDPDTSKGFIVANILGTGELAGAYTMGVEGAIVVKDSTLQGDTLMIASKWIPGALDAGFQVLEPGYKLLDKDTITMIDLPNSIVTQPLRDAAELTGGLNVIDTSSSMKTGYSNLQDNSLYIITTNIKLEETTPSNLPTTTTEKGKTGSEAATNNGLTSKPNQNTTQSQATTEDSDKNNMANQATDVARDYLTKHRTSLIVLIILILIALILIKR